MNNKKYYPFRRNNYFYGKLLTVRDFEEEQRYFNDKRRIGNFLLSGTGVVSGLGVICLDEKTISVEAGMAVDYLGREIVLEESVIKKLNVLEGFDSLEDFRRVYLCLEYAESLEEKVPSVTGGIDGNDSYNRVREGYRLFLTDTVNDEHLLTNDYLFEDKQVIYEDEAVKITQVVPRCVNAGEQVNVEVYIEKRNLPKLIEVDYTLNLSCFKDERGNHTLRVYYKDAEINKNKTEKLIFPVFADSVKERIGTMELAEDGHLTVGSDVYDIEKRCIFKTEITEGSFVDAGVKRYMERHMQDVLTVGSENCIYLAMINLIKMGEEYSIDYFEPMPFGQYFLSGSMVQSILKQERKRKAAAPKVAAADTETVVAQSADVMERYIASGEEIIEVELLTKSKSYFSEEIAHGLGRGEVLVHAAISEDFEENNIFSVKKNVFGDMSVFEGSDYEPDLAAAKLGIISYPDRGTFRVGLKFQRDAHVPAVQIKWWAVKSKKENSFNLSEVSSVRVMIQPNTVTLMPREQFKFEAIIEGTDSRECKWSVKDKDGGVIDINGVYTAPSKEGVYQIVVELVKYPNINASVFVVVKE